MQLNDALIAPQAGLNSRANELSLERQFEPANQFEAELRLRLTLHGRGHKIRPKSRLVFRNLAINTVDATHQGSEPE